MINISDGTANGQIMMMRTDPLSKHSRLITNKPDLYPKIFYSLNYQDLAEFFEDNMKVWMEGFHSLLTAPNIAHLESDSDDKAGPQEILKGIYKKSNYNSSF